MGGRESDRIWAAATLGVTDDPGAARAAFLRRLPGVAFVPPITWLAALRTLTGAPSASANGIAPDATEFHDGEASLRSDIEAFAARFWSLSLTERRAEWQALTERCRTLPPLSSRLRHLEAGLDIEAMPSEQGTRVTDLARDVQTLFVLPPAKRAAERAALIAARSDQVFAWEIAAFQLREWDPAVAALDSTYVERLAGRSATTGRIAELRERDPRQRARGSGWLSSPLVHCGSVVLVVFLTLFRALLGPPDPPRRDPYVLPPAPTVRTKWPQAPATDGTAELIPSLPTKQLEDRLRTLEGKWDQESLLTGYLIRMELKRRQAAPGARADPPGWPRLPARTPPEGRP